jgi:hypothetical protein
VDPAHGSSDIIQRLFKVCCYNSVTIRVTLPKLRVSFGVFCALSQQTNIEFLGQKVSNKSFHNVVKLSGVFCKKSSHGINRAKCNTAFLQPLLVLFQLPVDECVKQHTFDSIFHRVLRQIHP